MMSNRFYLGLDLGAAADYSALAILEAQGKEKGRAYHCGFLKRWPLKTSYPDIAADVAKLVARDELQKERQDYDSKPHHGYQSEMHAAWAETLPVLAVDNTGVGAPVVDLLKRSVERVQLDPIQITGGDSVTRDGWLTRVPKRDLVSAAQVALQSAHLKIAEELPEAQTLIRELLNFKVKISLDTAHDSYGAWREGEHDDLVLAVALALWIAENGITRGDVMLPSSYSRSRFANRSVSGVRTR
jgi:hypothetical protein